MQKTTNIFRSYLLRFFFRLSVFLAALTLYLRRREALDFTQTQPIAVPLRLFWVILMVSFALQLSPRAMVSRGCRKQFAETFRPTGRELKGDALRGLDRGALRVAVAWAIPNLLFARLYFRRFFGVPEMLLLTAFYYLCDVICIVFFCPFQRFWMKNKCCTTCRIFAWGTIMTVTPLLFVPHRYSYSLVALALVCTLRWELVYRRHPERFFEETNAFLTCADCTDRLCEKETESCAKQFGGIWPMTMSSGFTMSRCTRG